MQLCPQAGQIEWDEEVQKFSKTIHQFHSTVYATLREATLVKNKNYFHFILFS